MEIEETRTIIIDMPTTVKGFVFMDSTGCACIVLNARMPYETQMETYHHEMKHIICGDIDNKSYREYPEDCRYDRP